jgi:hypothetical protein
LRGDNDRSKEDRAKKSYASHDYSPSCWTGVVIGSVHLLVGK